jgi:outer membrane biosynthesis protein TonB
MGDARSRIMLSSSPLLSRSTLTTIACMLGLVGCVATQPAQPAPTAANAANAPASTATATTTLAAATAPSAAVTTDPVSYCDLVCERAQAQARADDQPDYTTRATANANSVLEDMHGDLLACYKKRVAVNPNAHGFITVDIVIDASGHVQTVETTGGAILGEGTMACIVNRIKRASFEPPHGGGTLRIHVPFSLRRVAPGEET